MTLHVAVSSVRYDYAEEHMRCRVVLDVATGAYTTEDVEMAFGKRWIGLSGAPTDFAARAIETVKDFTWKPTGQPRVGF